MQLIDYKWCMDSPDAPNSPDPSNSLNRNEAVNAPSAPDEQNHKRQILRRIRNEIGLEVGFVILCLVLAIGLSTKIMLAVVITCLKFAIPDFVTAYLVYQNDPDRRHGIALAFLFIAAGFARASLFAFVALIIVMLISVPIFGGPGVMGQAFDIGMETGLKCTIGFLFVVFPLTLVATIISWATNTKLEFASGLTKLRRSPEAKKESINLDVRKSIKALAITSAFSLTVVLISLLTVIESFLLVIGAFCLPLVWMPIFALITDPSRSNPHTLAE
jgi:hypothetical protein